LSEDIVVLLTINSTLVGMAASKIRIGHTVVGTTSRVPADYLKGEDKPSYCSVMPPVHGG
jgi:hypothetical protein